ncbi:MAG: hypothetical protein Q9213_002117 [Squamulea squamosa]
MAWYKGAAIQHAAFSTTSMGRLPPELLHAIFAVASTIDVINLRLTCRSLAELGFEYLAKDLKLLFNSASLGRVTEISKHPLLSKRVQSLNYRIDSLKRCSVDELYKSRFPLFDLRQLFDRRDRGPLPNRARRAYNRELVRTSDPQPTPRQLKAVKRKYFALLEDQRELRENRGFGIEDLVDIMGHLPNLKHVALSNSHDVTRDDINFHNSYPSDNPYKEIDPRLKGDEGMQSLRGVFQLITLLGALDRAGTKLESLSFGFVDWRVFENPDDDAFEMALQVAQTLKSIKMRLFMECSGPYLDANAIGCRELFKKGRPLTLLQSMPFLRNLELYVKSSVGMNTPNNTIDLSSLFGTHTWSDLQRISVHLFNTTQDELLGFFDRHVTTLKVVELNCGWIHQGSWSDVFTAVRRSSLKLQDCKLDNLCNGRDDRDDWHANTDSVLREYVLGSREVTLEDARKSCYWRSRHY